MKQFNATNVVLNSIRLTTPCKSGVRGGWRFGKVLRRLAQKIGNVLQNGFREYIHIRFYTLAISHKSERYFCEKF